MRSNQSLRRDKMIGALHPLLALAAVAVIVFSGVGVWTMTRHQDIADTFAANATIEPAVQGAPAPQRLTEPRRVEAAAPAPAPVRVAEACSNCGKVESVTWAEKEGRGTGVGAVAGGVIGGLLGHQIGSGHGKTAATVAGAAAGAYGGNRVEENRNSSKVWTVTVRMNDGERRTFSQSSEPGWQVGENVRVVDGHLSSEG
ncbi:hypothetical protein BH09PSE6_BH09PSE6_27750 [soil metagenome]